MFSFEQEVLTKQYWGGNEQDRAGLLDYQSEERCAQWVTSKMMTAKTWAWVRSPRDSEKNMKDRNADTWGCTGKEEAEKKLRRLRKTQLERWKKSQDRPRPSRPRNFQESIISYFPLNSRILWSQLTVVMISGLAKRLIRKGKVQRFLEVYNLQFRLMSNCLCQHKTKNNFVSSLVELVEYFLSLHILSICFLKFFPGY